MKILAKKAIDVQVTAQKKAQIDEGVAIATKIDALRQTLLSLEAQHKNFIDGMKDSLNIETKYLIEKIANLKLEISNLEEEREKLLIPLTSAWDSVNERDSILQVKEKEVDRREKVLIPLEVKATEREEKTKEAFSRIKVRERELIKVYDSAETLKKEAEDINKQVVIGKERSEKDIETRYSVLKTKEEQAQYSLEFYESKKSVLDARERELNQKETLINDRYQTLLRTQARLKK